MDSLVLRIETGGHLVTDLTGEVAAFCRGRGVVLVDPNRDNPLRTVRLGFLAG